MPAQPESVYTVLLAYAPIVSLLVTGVIVPLVTRWLAKKIETVHAQVETMHAQVVEVKSSVGDVKSTVGDVKSDIAKVEKATNSMKDELVKATAEAAKEAGRAEERAEQARIEAARVKGAMEQRDTAKHSPPKEPG